MDLMDAVVGQRSGSLARALPRDGPAMQHLSEALRREDKALLGSMRRAIASLRGEAPHRPSVLAAAHRAVEDLLRALGDERESFANLTDEQKRGLLADLDARRRLVLRQTAIEDWFGVWQRSG